MFDDVNKKNSGGNGAQRQPAEDIFSETETAEKPKVFQPKEKETADFPAESPMDGVKLKDIKKYLMLFAIALGVVVLALASYWAYSAFFQQAEPGMENHAENISIGANEQDNIPGQIKNKDQAQDSAPAGDSDQDGLTNQEEAGLGTSSESVDSDGDGLFDREEVKVYQTDPLNADTDGDGFLDGEEVKDGYNPNGPGNLFNR
ncbi:thrombospondin type 3 repeat-containing protein [Patescibacteria group bacterium]|nr:hypothetical protein [Candidatus Falkowbacteria bacterium]MBU3906266.1 thrombospondin type 3 repeat-containing protein [Patescibacteria group bacterium]MBU4015027.1 thrombospondin type 3 repeat-containing protein [Patescibacteria group bacterium]MBU4026437.1 thrombospondin type 3 repeat-containing protein [Patescibacteria group bacterium]MBU4072580.1 thrombospondin type 3 repeat-containing protein [Patescibacteria group bacterium]